MRPWVLRALVMTLLYGVGQTAFVALSSRFVDQTLWWTVLLLGLLLLVGLVWGGAEVIADRVPPEWTWVKASLTTGPAAGLLNWILLTVFVDSVGVEDLGSALVGRAAFTVLLVLTSVSLGSWFGWLSLRRSGDPRAERDPGADVDAPGEDALALPTTRAGEPAEAPVLPASTAERVAARRARRLSEREARESGHAPSPSPAPAARSASPDDDPVRVPFGGGPFGDPPSSPTPAAPATGSGYASPVVAVLPPVAPLPTPGEQATGSGADDAEADDHHRGSRRRFGLRRPSPGPDASGESDAER
ncbi:hypothetical protein [Actinomycetospora sp. TBRC 11914]|uniref:hypothetical protein n=1 Tax=Actinomycetospora sp. TBRC 11914 TaxID=2729387 RepID=UPI00145D81FF|nr:hypothetical protein [Actinomycetospora sp. TBRC 11914]NMO89641.1 hypothetical protein [Actinomycetospora sp. TBRC 11914]